MKKKKKNDIRIEEKRCGIERYGDAQADTDARVCTGNVCTEDHSVFCGQASDAEGRHCNRMRCFCSPRPNALYIPHPDSIMINTLLSHKSLYTLYASAMRYGLCVICNVYGFSLFDVLAGRFAPFFSPAKLFRLRFQETIVLSHTLYTAINCSFGNSTYQSV